MRLVINLNDLTSSFTLGFNLVEGIEKDTEEEIKVFTIGLLFIDINFIW